MTMTHLTTNLTVPAQVGRKTVGSNRAPGASPEHSTSVQESVTRAAAILTLVLLLLHPGTAGAAPTYYSGIDPNAGGISGESVSLSTQTSFLAAAGAVTSYSFESLTVNNHDLNVLNGYNFGAFSMAFNNNDADDVYDEDMELENPGNTDETNGWNTTPGGDKYLYLQPTANVNSTATITFAAPIDEFGLFVTGLGNQDCTVVVSFNDGAAQSFTLEGGQGTGGAEYFGFIDPGAKITTITFDQNNVGSGTNRDRYSIDDIVYQTTPPNVALTKSVSPTTSLVPGTNLTYSIAFSNTGYLAAKTLVISDIVPAHTQFKVGSPTTTLGTTGLTAAITYSDDGGNTWTYTPTSGAGGAPAGYDRLVSNLRWTFTGSLSSTSPNNAGSVSFVAEIE